MAGNFSLYEPEEDPTRWGSLLKITIIVILIAAVAYGCDPAPQPV